MWKIFLGGKNNQLHSDILLAFMISVTECRMLSHEGLSTFKQCLVRVVSILCVRETLCDVYIICQESRLIGQPSIQDELYRRLDNVALDESL